MKTRIFIAAMLLFATCNLYAAESEKTVMLQTDTGTLEGTLLVPNTSKKIPAALIIAGSGPTDRDGNNPAMTNNSLKMLAVELSKKEIASLRYDKRGIGESKIAACKEEDLRFEHYISDAQGWIEFLKKDKRFKQIIIIGHSEGSLLGMIVSQKINVDKFISIAGSGRSADKSLKEQLKSQPPEILEMSLPIIDKLVQGKTVSDVHPILYSLFRPSVQPYMISWFKYDPAQEIAKLKIPVLIIQGSTDIQVSKNDAEMLAKANQKAEIRIIEGMNHIFKKAELDRMKNIQTYNQPQLPVMPELIESIVGFIDNK
ncbi:MAG: alpha/beta hydrolase [Proteobacteria bacterium]|nr:alpha/beta hydrolase [Pseudomonadota bacterium]